VVKWLHLAQFTKYGSIMPLWLLMVLNDHKQMHICQYHSILLYTWLYMALNPPFDYMWLIMASNGSMRVNIAPYYSRWLYCFIWLSGDFNTQLWLEN
jgi:hypothetical protein